MAATLEVRGGPLTMRQLERWTKDRLLREIRDADNRIARMSGGIPNRYQPNSVLRHWKNHDLARHLLDRFDQHEALLRAQEERERRLNDEAVRRTLGLTVDGRSVYEGVAAP